MVIDHCREALRLDEPYNVREFAHHIDPERSYFLPDEWRWEVRRIWYDYVKGKFDFNDEVLELMERAAEGTKELWRHPFWKFLAGDPFSIHELVAIIRRLPDHVFGCLLITTPAPISAAYVTAIPDAQDLYAVQSLGTLDAVTALLAFAQLHTQEPKGGELAICDVDLEIARAAATAAVRLLVRLSCFSPFIEHSDEILEILQKTFVGMVVPTAFEESFSLAENYDLLVHLVEQYNIVESGQDEGLELLAIADRTHFDLIVGAADWTYDRIRSRGDIELPAPLVALANAYRNYRDFKDHIYGETQFYPEENLRAFDAEMGTIQENLEASGELRGTGTHIHIRPRRER